MFGKLFACFKKSRPAHHHILSATLIIAYWWAIWYILDILFITHSFTFREIISICAVGVVSVIGMYLIEADFSDLE